MRAQHSRFARTGRGGVFLVAMAAVIGLAQLFPDAGADGGWLHPELTNKLGVSLIFFLHGLMLSADALGAGVLRWRLHLVVQSTTFLAFPLFGLAATGWLQRLLGTDLSAGFLYLCVLPSTVSSSVVLTASARGNVAGALFNASLSSVLGLFLTPLWVGLVLETDGRTLPLARAVQDLLVWLLLPLGVGQLLRRLVGEGVERFKSRVGLVDRFTILLLIYTSMAASVKAEVFRDHGLRHAGWVLLLCAALLVTAKAAVWLVTRAGGEPRGDRIAALFCGSQKTLAAGVPMAHLIFGTDPALGALLLPILVYHPMQLLVGAWLAERFARLG